MTFPYATGADLIARGECDLTDPAEADALVAAASDVVYQMLGGAIVPKTSVTVRPVRRCESYDPLRYPSRALGGFVYPSMYRCCSGPDVINLQAPVASIEEIKIDGVTLPSTTYTFDPFSVRRVDGLAWPIKQNPALPSTDPDTFAISYTFGEDIPGIVHDATLDLAVDLWRDGCLPDNVTGRNSQGVSYSYSSPAEIEATGPQIQKLAIAISAFNPSGLRLPSWAWSPDEEWVLYPAA